MTREEVIKRLNEFILFKKISNITEEEAVECFKLAVEALQQQPSEDCISRQAAIDALWKALHEYEDKTENQFSESKELDVADWFQRRIFVQNMSDIDRQTILNLPSVNPQPSEHTEERTETHECESKADKALNLLAEWAIECGFGFDNIPEEYEKYKDDIAEMGYTEGLVYIVKMESEAKQ